MPEAKAINTKSGLEDLLVPGRHGAAIDPPGARACERRGVAVATVAVRRDKLGVLTEKVRSEYGLDLPEGARLSSVGSIAFVGIGPGRWFVLGNGVDGHFVETLAASLRGIASVSDQSSAYVILDLEGARARDVLAKGVNIDLHPRSFGVGQVASTSISHIAVSLWQSDRSPRYEIAVPRSRAASFLHWLLASAAEFGLEIHN